MSKENSMRTLEDGIYKLNYNSSFMGYVHIDGNDVEFTSTVLGVEKGDKLAEVEVTYGKFDHADKRGLSNTTRENYDVKLVFPALDGMDSHGIFIPNEKNVILRTGELLEYVDEDAIIKFEEYAYEQTDY